MILITLVAAALFVTLGSSLPQVPHDQGSKVVVGYTQNVLVSLGPSMVPVALRQTNLTAIITQKGRETVSASVLQKVGEMVDKKLETSKILSKEDLQLLNTSNENGPTPRGCVHDKIFANIIAPHKGKETIFVWIDDCSFAPRDNKTSV